MDVCARICQHYLSGDNVPDIEFVDGKPVFPEVVPKIGEQQQRKILIYSESPSVTVLLKNVSPFVKFNTMLHQTGPFLPGSRALRDS